MAINQKEILAELRKNLDRLKLQVNRVERRLAEMRARKIAALTYERMTKKNWR